MSSCCTASSGAVGSRERMWMQYWKRRKGPGVRCVEPCRWRRGRGGRRRCPPASYVGDAKLGAAVVLHAVLVVQHNDIVGHAGHPREEALEHVAGVVGVDADDGGVGVDDLALGRLVAGMGRALKAGV